MAWQKRRIKEEEKSEDAAKARAKAMELLAGREHSSAELYQKLCGHFTEQAAAQAVAELVELDYVDDRRYAVTKTRSLLNARKSRRAAAQTLGQKGLTRLEVEEALEAVYAPDGDTDPEQEAALALLRGSYRRRLIEGRRDLVTAALQRRGFRWAAIKAALQTAEEEIRNS